MENDSDGRVLHDAPQIAAESVLKCPKDGGNVKSPRDAKGPRDVRGMNFVRIILTLPGHHSPTVFRSEV